MLPHKSIKKLMSIFQPKVFLGCAVIGCIGLAGFFGVNTYKSKDLHGAVTLYKTSQQRTPQARSSEALHPAAPGNMPSHGEASHAHETDPAPNRKTYPWRDAETFEPFDRLLKTDPEAARRELQNIAKNFFSGHILAEEWVPLYFRITRDGFRHTSDVKRVHELEIRMLTAINAEKYSKQIQQHQEAIEYYTEHPNVISNVADKMGNETHVPIKNHPEMAAAAQHFQHFFTLIDTNPEASRKELEGIHCTIIPEPSTHRRMEQILFSYGSSLTLHVGIETALGALIAMSLLFSKQMRGTATEVLEKVSGQTLLLMLAIMGVIAGFVFLIPRLATHAREFLKTLAPLLENSRLWVDVIISHSLLWICQGLAFFLFLRSLSSVQWADAGVLTANYAFAWIIQRNTRCSENTENIMAASP